VTPVRCRFEAIEGTMNWACTIVAMELDIRDADGRVQIAATVHYYGDDFSDDPIESLTCNMTGVCVDQTPETLVLEIDQPAPITQLAIDPSKPLIEYMFAFSEGWKRHPLPSFWMPLLNWASTKGMAWHMPLGSLPPSP
jgi:hypothetical protein